MIHGMMHSSRMHTDHSLSWGGLCPRGIRGGVSVQEGSLSGGSLSRGCLCTGGVCPGGYVQRDVCQGDPLPLVNRMTHTCENITLLQTFTGGKNMTG